MEEASQKGWSESWDTYANERTWTVLDALFAVAEETGKTPAQVALRWLLQKPGVTAPIIGARTIEHLETNLGAAGWSAERSADETSGRGQRDESRLPGQFDQRQPAQEIAFSKHRNQYQEELSWNTAT